MAKFEVEYKHLNVANLEVEYDPLSVAKLEVEYEHLFVAKLEVEKIYHCCKVFSKIWTPDCGKVRSMSIQSTVAKLGVLKMYNLCIAVKKAKLTILPMMYGAK